LGYATIKGGDRREQHSIPYLNRYRQRELALMDAIDKLFPAAAHFLCRWHVNMNVLAKTKKFFPKPVRGNDGVYRRHQKFKDFLMDWNALLLSTSKTTYDNALKKIEAVYDKGAMSYVTSTWLIF
jgi:hypothetical protein